MSKIKNFIDENGKVISWPSKRTLQKEIVVYIGDKFKKDKEYTETEVNEIIKGWILFNDYALVRRELIVENILTRDSVGKCYQVLKFTQNQI